MHRRRANDLSLTLVLNEHRRNVCTNVAPRLGLPNLLTCLCIQSHHRRNIARRSEDHLVIIYERALRCTPHTRLALIYLAAVHLPYDLTIGCRDTRNLTRATDNVRLAIGNSGCCTSLGIGLIPRLAILNRVELLTLKSICREGLHRLILVHTRQIDSIAHNNRARITLTCVHRLPQLLRTARRPLLQKSRLGIDTITLGATPAVGRNLCRSHRSRYNCNSCQRSSQKHLLHSLNYLILYAKSAFP